MTQRSGKELQVRKEVFDVCESLFTKGYTTAKDYTFDAVKAERISLFGKGGHYETLKRYRDEWLQMKGLSTKSPALDLMSSAESPVVYSAIEHFLEAQRAEMRAELEEAYETQLVKLTDERDNAKERAEITLRQQHTFKSMLDNKQAQIDGFSVLAKAHLDKTGELERINYRLEHEVTALSKRLQTIEQAHQDELASVINQYEIQLSKILTEQTERYSQFKQMQQQLKETNDKLLDTNERQRIEAMNERVALEDVLRKTEKQCSLLQRESEKKLSKHQLNEMTLSQRVKEVENEVTQCKQENAELKSELRQEQQTQVLLKQLIKKQQSQDKHLVKLAASIKTKSKKRGTS